LEGGGGRAEVDIVVVLSRLCVRRKAELGYVEVQSVTVVSAQSTPASSSEVYPSADSPT
jgi:hypothetical protein